MPNGRTLSSGKEFLGQIRWKVRWNIVSIFLVLLCVFSLIVTSFSYYQDHKGILKLSSSQMQIVTDGVIETINDSVNQVKLLGKVTKGVLKKADDLTLHKELLTRYFLNALISDPNVFSISISTKEGAFLSANNLSLVQSPHYYLNPLKPLPNGSRYAVRCIDRSGDISQEVWEYKDSDMATLETERLPHSTYDPRLETWYNDVAAWPHLRWDTNRSAQLIQVSVPVADQERVVYAVVQVSLSLEQLSNVISHQQIGLSGKAFVLDKTGELLVPLKIDDDWSILINTAYAQFKKTGNRNLFLKKDQKSYLVNFSLFPLDYQTKWWVASIVPFNDYFGPILKTMRLTVVVSFFILLIFAFIAFLASNPISSPIVKLAKQADLIRNLDFAEREPLKSHISELSALISSFSTMRVALRSFAHYVPKEIVHTLIQQGKEITVGGERKEIIVMFSDIENFTTAAETLPIEELMKTLSEYFKTFSKIIVETEGTIDKYIGDSIMAFWNAPKQVVEPADKACLACLHCLKITKDGKESNLFLKQRTRFGIHSGEVIVGNIGTEERLNYTVIGNVVNTASRLQSLNKEYHTSSIISETVHEQLGTRFVTRPLDYVVVKGRKKAITLFELVGLSQADTPLSASSEERELCLGFTQAYNKFHEGKIEEATAEFIALHERFPTDFPTKIYLDRLQRGAAK